MSEESTWGLRCRNLVLFYSNVCPGKGCGDVSWPRTTSFPPRSHDSTIPSFPSLHPETHLSWLGHMAQAWGCFFRLSPFSFHPLPTAHSDMCWELTFLGHRVPRGSGDCQMPIGRSRAEPRYLAASFIGSAQALHGSPSVVFFLQAPAPGLWQTCLPSLRAGGNFSLLAYG